jgi:hypothetical protein
VLLRLFRAAPVAPAWVGLGIVLAYLALLGLVVAGFAAFDPPGVELLVGHAQWRWELVNALLIGYLVTANVYALEGALRDLRDLRPHLTGEGGVFDEIVESVTRAWPWLLPCADAVGVGIAAAMVLFDPGLWGGRPHPRLADPFFLWVLVKNAAIGICTAHALATELVLTRGFFRVGGRRVRVDLLDLRPLVPFARKAQRSVVVWVGYCVLMSLFWLGGQAARSNPWLLASILTVVSASFALSLLGVHGSIARAKSAELGRVTEAIRRARDSALAVPGGPGARAGALADLAAYRELVAATPEWPLSTPALLRSLLFVVLGVGSWVGGALADRVLGRLLD